MLMPVLTLQMNPSRGLRVLTNLQKPPLQMISKLTDHAMSGLEVRHLNYCIHANPGLTEGTTLARFK